jgi:hypothetical protein
MSRGRLTTASIALALAACDSGHERRRERPPRTAPRKRRRRDAPAKKRRAATGRRPKRRERPRRTARRRRAARRGRAPPLADAAGDAAPPDPDAVPPPVELCDRPGDEDRDGRFDCADPDCFAAPVCVPAVEVCGNGLDDEGDGRVDCCDPDCTAVCPPLEVEAFTEAEVQMLFDTECDVCHMDGRRDGTLALDAPFLATTLDAMSEQLRDMAIITAGDRQRSYLFHKVNDTHQQIGGAGLRMPVETGLCVSDIERLGLYIDALVAP